MTQALLERPVTEADRRAAAGAGALDAERPGWENEISLRRLDISHGGDCILGQLYDDYTLAPHSLRRQGATYGFVSQPWYADDPSYRELTRAWRHLIQARRAGRPGFIRRLIGRLARQ